MAAKRGGWEIVCGRYRVRASGDVAQLAEHLLCKQDVVGSIPIVSTIKAPGSKAARGFLVLRAARPCGTIESFHTAVTRRPSGLALTTSPVLDDQRRAERSVRGPHHGGPPDHQLPVSDGESPTSRRRSFAENI
jgi:hypothetical protein